MSKQKRTTTTRENAQAVCEAVKNPTNTATDIKVK